MEYFPVYYDAYVGSADNAWLRNCALIYLSEGSYAKAAEMKPKDTSDSKDAYFWALTMFDSRHFGESIDFLEISRKLLSSVPNRKERRLLDENIALLLGDSYTSLKDVQALRAQVPEELKPCLDEILSLGVDYERICVSLLYYSKMRYYDALFFRFLDAGAVYCNGGNYEIDGLKSSGFALLVDALIEKIMQKDEK